VLDVGGGALSVSGGTDRTGGRGGRGGGGAGWRRVWSRKHEEGVKDPVPGKVVPPRGKNVQGGVLKDAPDFCGREVWKGGKNHGCHASRVRGSGGSAEKWAETRSRRVDPVRCEKLWLPADKTPSGCEVVRRDRRVV